MSILKSDKAMLGAGLMFLILNVAILAPIATGAVPDAVAEATAEAPKDDICSNADCTEVEADWASSSTDRDFYGWNLTNLGEVLAGGAPVYDEVGPVTYTISSERHVMEHNSTSGELTYHETTSYACSADTVVPCDVQITQLNIGFMPQVIGATGTAMAGIMDLTKVGFAAQMINQDMNTTQAGTATTADMCFLGILYGPCHMWAMGGEAAWKSSDTGMGIMAMNNDSMLNNATGDWSAGVLDAAMDNTFHPFDPNFNISLKTDLGPVAFMGMGQPEMMISEVMADPSNSTIMQRASTYGYLSIAMMLDMDDDGIDETAVPDFYTTFVRDWTMYAAVGTSFAGYGGGTDFNASNNDDITSRLHNLLGVDFAGANGIALMVAGHLTDTPTGLIATNADGTGFGLAAFLTMEVADAMAAFNLTVDQYTAVATWAGAWATSASSAQLGLLGGVGTMNAEQFVNQTFGGMSPVGDPYLTNSLNMGGAWGTALVPGSAGAPPVDINQTQAGNMLYGPLGLTTSTGATVFLYGELSGMTPPVDFATMGPGTAMEWNTATIAALYGVDENTAGAMRAFMFGAIFGDFVPGFLIDSFGTSPYLTQEFNNWLLGWHDPVSAFLASGNPMDMSVGWTSLESNATYYGSGGIQNSDGTMYTICTGESDSCDKGTTLAIDGSSYFSWKDPAKAANTFGLITAEQRAGTIGGFLASGDNSVDLSGYATADIECSGTDTLKGIPVDTCTATLDPLTRNIQAKLLDTDTLLDAVPGALPVYFGSDVTMSVEQVSQAAIAGSSESYFYLDSRPITSMNEAPTIDDLQPVFKIVSTGEISDSDAETLESLIVTNQETFGYWTNFDNIVDYITVMIYLGAVVALVNGVRLMMSDEETDEEATPGEKIAVEAEETPETSE
tara:strand:- start:409 stop:3111 length:2703 start_codon:yes stop_codon:yes gene_type:complete